MERGVPIRSVSRSIAVLQVINRHGSLSLTEIARNSGLPYPTASRIIQTLIHERLVECEPSRKHYRPTALVQTLSLGFRGNGNLISAARTQIEGLTKRIGWPVAIVTHVGPSMIVTDSTHMMSSLTFHIYQPGYTMPILECASGHVFLAYASAKTRASIIKGLEEIEERALALSMFKSGKLVAQIREDGYATYHRNPHSMNPGKTSSIAVPILESGNVVAALTMIFFSSAMPVAEAVQRYVEVLQGVAEKVGGELARRKSGVYSEEQMGQSEPVLEGSEC